MASMQKMTINNAVQVAKQHLQSGRISEAESILRQVLDHAPNHAEATHCLAFAVHQHGNVAGAVELVRRSIALDPSVAIYHQNLGDLLAAQSLIDDAEAEFRRAAELDPRLASAVMKLGMAMETRGRFEEAAAFYRRAIAIAPDYPEAHCNLGDAMAKLDRLEPAIEAYSDAIALNPQLVEAYANRASALDRAGRYAEALADAQHAMALRPEFFEAACTAGKVLAAMNRPAEALQLYRRALQLRGDSALAYNGLGVAQLALFRHEDACAAWRMAIECDPTMADPYTNLGLTLGNLGRHDQAMSVFDRGMEVAPDSMDLRVNRALTLLTLGDFEQGWREYEQRWMTPAFNPAGRGYDCPRWQGEPLAGKTILIWHEQGFGDTIQCIRYARLLAASGATVIAEVPRPLRRLMESAPGVSTLITPDDPPPPADFHCAMMDLPARFKTTLETIPTDVPYLMPDAALVAKWQEILASPPDVVRVGLVWRGQPLHRRDRERSVSLQQFAPLSRIKGAHFYSLQKGEGAEQARSMPGDLPITELGVRLNDFAETAAALAHLDLLISVDTALVHLAGALARPVWTLLPYSPDFRWLLNRTDSPWYPTMRLFRQPAFHTWGPVFAEVAAALEGFVASRREIQR
jgi:tetratricopeptide (TPR) repeat protein